MSGSQTSPVLVHATSVVLADACAPFGGPVDGAVLLIGRSEAGKSDVALRLIAMGAKLISDDQTALSDNAGRLFAAAPPSLHGRMEVRGVGIVNVTPAPPAPVVLAVRLDEAAEVPRLPGPLTHKLPQGLENAVEPPFLVLHAFEASTPMKIAAAASALSRGAFVAGLSTP
jgi:serine kinase of HPr protein (carbohydrate metabolism regulator)